MREQDLQEGALVRIIGIRHPKESFPYLKGYIGAEGEILKTERVRFWHEAETCLAAVVMFPSNRLDPHRKPIWKILSFHPDELELIKPPPPSKAPAEGSARTRASSRKARGRGR